MSTVIILREVKVQNYCVRLNCCIKGAMYIQFDSRSFDAKSRAVSKRNCMGRSRNRGQHSARGLHGVFQHGGVRPGYGTLFVPVGLLGRGLSAHGLPEQLSRARQVQPEQ